LYKLLIIGTGGFLGAVARYWLSGLAHRFGAGFSFPLGTFVVNVIGCLLIGVLMGVVEDRQALSANVRLFLFMGLLGSFTTFSTLSYETYDLFRSGELVAALAYVAGSALIGLAAVALGRAGVNLLVVQAGSA